MKIPLFDLDWTLIRGGNVAHQNSFAHAFRVVYGIEAQPQEINTAGMIDSEIMLAILERHNVSKSTADALLRNALRTMEKYFEAQANEAAYEAMPGAIDLLTELHMRGGMVGILTGNIAYIAWQKCKRAGLRHLIHFGAFGNEGRRRADLVGIALERAGTFGQFVIVGDTPKDIDCAKATNLKSVGVTTGQYTVADLEAAGADLVVETLGDPELLRFLE